MKKIAFIIPPTVELLDLAGPVQVFTEARFYGLEIGIEFFLYRKDPVSTSGLTFGQLPVYHEAQLNEGDFVFIPGMDQDYIRTTAFRNEKKFFRWLANCHAKNVIVCSICNGAFALGEAGLLNDVECTTHWRRVDELHRNYPKAKVLTDVLFVKNKYPYTSGGIMSGIDLALSILEDMAGAHFTHKVARGLVVYHRRNSKRRQRTHYLDFRNHINVKVHDVQDYLVHNIEGDTSLSDLARIVGMSPRNLTRVFKETTGSTIKEYITQIRLDKARMLLRDPKSHLSSVAKKCGFGTERQLQRILKKGI